MGATVIESRGWPLFEDGEPARMGDRVWFGEESLAIEAVEFRAAAGRVWSLVTLEGGEVVFVDGGHPLKRPRSASGAGGSSAGPSRRIHLA